MARRGGPAFSGRWGGRGEGAQGVRGGLREGGMLKGSSGEAPQGGAGAPPRMRLDPARARGRGKDEGAEGRGASLQYRASAFMPPPGKTAKDTAECRICLQTVA